MGPPHLVPQVGGHTHEEALDQAGHDRVRHLHVRFCPYPKPNPTNGGHTWYRRLEDTPMKRPQTKPVMTMSGTSTSPSFLP